MFSAGNDKTQIEHYRGNFIGMIFQEPMTSLNPVLTCGLQVKETLRAHLKLNNKQATEKTIELFRLVELPDPELTFLRYPHQLSGGQRQRVMIAIAICCNPLLLIADEPTTALDALIQKNIINLLQKISNENKLAVLLITHDLALVSQVAHRLIVMQEGRIVEQGNTQNILISPATTYTKALIACRPSSNDPHKYLPTIREVIEEKYHPAEKIKRTEDDTVVLDVKDLNVYYLQKQSALIRSVFLKAVDGINMTVRKNEIVGLVGESGSGKSSFGKALLKLIPVTSGKVILDGTDLISLSEKELRESRKKIQMVFQDPYSSMNPSMRIKDILLEPLIIHKAGTNKWRLEKVVTMLEKLELNAALLDRYPHEFSGGQRQRICIARALITDPAFVVFDESVSALDVSVQAQVLNMINKLKEEMNFSALFISHDLAVVHYISDRIYVIRAGKIVESGDSDQLYRFPENPYTRTLIEAIPGRNLQVHP